MAIQQTLDVSQLRSFLAQTAAGLRPRDPKKTLAACAVVLKNELKRMMQAGVSPDGTPYAPLKHARPNGKSHPLWDTGALVRSVGAGAGHVERISGDSLEIGTNLEYAAVHQYGATITPKKGKYLAIPLTMAAKRAGSPRNFPTLLKPIMGKRGGVLVGGTPKRRKGVPIVGKAIAQYALVRSVRLEARPFIGFSPKMVDDCESVLLKGLGA